MATIRLTEWEKYQHYNKPNPPWVKLYRDTLTSPCWINGGDLERALMVGCMMLAARYNNAIPFEWGTLQPTLALKCTERQFTLAVHYLISRGFIELEGNDSRESLALVEESRGEERQIPPKSPKGDEHESFSDFWKAYPSRGKAANPRKPAVKAHLAAIKRGADPAELIRLAPTAAPVEKHGTEFVPQATTWLNEDRWKDASKPVDVVHVNFNPERSLWLARVRSWRSSKFWNRDQWGPTPSETGCRAPPDVLDEVLNLTMAG